MLRIPFCLALVSVIMSLVGSLANAQGDGQPAPLSQEDILVRQVATRMGGGPSVWWVINTQYSSSASSVRTKARAHTVVQGTEAAARMIVAYSKGKNPRNLRVNWEAYRTEQEAELRAAWWRQYDIQAGYR